MKKPFLLSAFILIVFPSFLSAQKKTEGHWGKIYLDVAYSTAATNDGGYIVTGLTKSGTDSTGDIIVIKLSASGDTIWTLVYGGPLLEGGNFVMQTADGGYMVSGHTEDFGAQDCDAFMMKLNGEGKCQWLKVYGGEEDDISESVVELSNGDFVLAGITASNGNTDSSDRRHVYFVKTTAAGDIIWTKYYAGKGVEYANSIVSMPMGGFLASGWSTSFGKGEQDGWLLRLNDHGETLWTRLYQNGGNSRFNNILPTRDNGYLITGYTSGTNNDKPQGLVIKLDADGRQVWEKTYGASNEGLILLNAAQLPNGNYIFSGTSYFPDTLGNAYVLTLDVNGNIVSKEICGGSGSYANCIAIQGNNSYLLVGASPKYGDVFGDLYYIETDNTVSGITNVPIEQAKFFPNPVKDKSIIILPATDANQTVDMEIRNSIGQLINRRTNLQAKEIVIDRNLFSNGQYFYLISCRNGKEYKGKFVVN